MWNLNAATHLKEVGTGAKQLWKSKKYSNKTAGVTFHNYQQVSTMIAYKNSSLKRHRFSEVKMGRVSPVCKKFHLQITD